LKEFTLIIATSHVNFIIYSYIISDLELYPFKMARNNFKFILMLRSKMWSLYELSLMFVYAIRCNLRFVYSGNKTVD
jgi:hypothetical protein